MLFDFQGQSRREVVATFEGGATACQSHALSSQGGYYTLFQPIVGNYYFDKKTKKWYDFHLFFKSV